MGRENGLKVLVADDDELARRMLDALLTEAGYRVVMARDGQEALAIAAGQDPPRILLLDWVMPGIEGVEVCRRLDACFLVSQRPKRARQRRRRIRGVVDW